MEKAKIFTKALLVMVLLLLFTRQAFAPPSYSGGNGRNMPFQIGSVDDILEMRSKPEDWGANFILIADINLAEQDCFTTAVIAPDGSNAGTYYDGTPFTGTFDGDGYVIKNLCIDTNGADNDFLGFFGKVEGGEVLKLGFENVSITGGNVSGYIGALAGEIANTSTVANCWSSGSVTKGGSYSTHTSEIGGLIGRGYNISYCYSTCNVNAGNYSRCVGGMAGSGSNITCSYYDGDVNTGSNMMEVGGLVGSGSIINYCYSTGSLKTGSSPDRLGGLAGTYSGPSMTDCYSQVHISAQYPSSAAGLVGYNFSADVNNCYATGPIDVTGYKYAVVYNYGGRVTDCFYDSNLITEPWVQDMNATPKTTEEMQTESTFTDAGWDFVGETTNGTDDIWRICEGKDYPELWWQLDPLCPPKYSGGIGDVNDPYIIADTDDLIDMSNSPDDWDKHFLVIADINLVGLGCFTTAVIAPDIDNGGAYYDGTPFTGVFDGGGNVIYGLCIDTNGLNNDFLGLFGKVAGGQILDLGLENVSITAGDVSAYIGALAGENTGTSSISNCYSTGSVSKGGSSSAHTAAVGGLLGWGYNISYCYSTCDVNTGNYSWYVGGLAGSVANVTCSSYSGSVTAGDNARDVGGMAGSAGGFITSSYSTGSVTTGSDPANLGGLVGNYSGSSMTNCYSTATVTGEYQCNGAGLVGYNFGSKIDNCYATGPINVTGYAYAVVNNFWAPEGSITDLFYDSNTIEGPLVWALLPGYATGKTTAEMQTESTFTDAGWDFESNNPNEPVWEIDEGVSYPTLLCGAGEVYTYIHVLSIDMQQAKASQSQYIAEARVTVVDQYHNPVQGAVVWGDWSGLTTNSDIAITDINGQATLESYPAIEYTPGVYTFTVTDVFKQDWTYDSDKNHESSDSI